MKHDKAQIELAEKIIRESIHASYPKAQVSRPMTFEDIWAEVERGSSPYFELMKRIADERRQKKLRKSQGRFND